MNIPGEFDPPVGEKIGKKSPYRADSFRIEDFTDEAKIIPWMNKTMKLPLEAIDEAMVDRTYPAAVWMLRKAAFEGNLKATNAMKIWLEWAKPIIDKPKAPKETTRSVGSVAFLPREPGEEKE